MPLDPKALGRTLDENLTLHTTLCRREAAAFQQAVRGSGEVVVACTQEKRLFVELARETEGAVAPVRFVNIRETGGWSADGGCWSSGRWRPPSTGRASPARHCRSPCSPPAAAAHRSAATP